MATATFVTLDTTTRGSWVGVYGSDGYEFPLTLTPSLPGYVSGWATRASAGAASTFQWGTGSSTDYLQDPANPTGTRYAITWYDSGGSWLELEFDVGSTARRVAVNFFDQDGSGTRALSVEVRDTNGGAAVLDTQSVSSFTSPCKWLVWDVTGKVTIRVTKTAGTNPVAAMVAWSTPGGAAAPVGKLVQRSQAVMAATY